MTDPDYIQTLIDELVRQGRVVHATDDQGNLIYRKGQPVYVLSPQELNKKSGEKGLN